MPSIATARDDMIGMVNTAWTAVGAPTENVTLLFGDVSGDEPNSGSTYEIQPFGRATVQHFGGGQTSLSNDTGSKTFTRTGLITVQIFTPAGDGYDLADAFAKVVLDAFEGKQSTNGVWFRNARLTEVGRSGAWTQTNVLVDFTYDETK